MKSTTCDLRFAICALCVLTVAPWLASAQQTNGIYLIDLPTALRLAGAQNLDVQIARERLAEAKANHESAVAQFVPWLSPGAAYRRHENRIQAVDGSIFDADKQSYSVGGSLTWTAVRAMAEVAEQVRDGGDFSGLRGPGPIKQWLAG